MAELDISQEIAKRNISFSDSSSHSNSDSEGDAGNVKKKIDYSSDEETELPKQLQSSGDEDEDDKKSKDSCSDDNAESEKNDSAPESGEEKKDSDSEVNSSDDENDEKQRGSKNEDEKTSIQRSLFDTDSQDTYDNETTRNSGRRVTAIRELKDVSIWWFLFNCVLCCSYILLCLLMIYNLFCH